MPPITEKENMVQPFSYDDDDGKIEKLYKKKLRMAILWIVVERALDRIPLRYHCCLALAVQQFLQHVRSPRPLNLIFRKDVQKLQYIY